MIRNKIIQLTVLILLLIYGSETAQANTWYFTTQTHPTIASRWLQATFAGGNNNYTYSGNFTGERLITNGTATNSWTITSFGSNVTIPAGTWSFFVTGNTTNRWWYPRIKIYDSNNNLIHTSTSPTSISGNTYMSVSWTDSLPAFNVGPGGYYRVQVFTYHDTAGNRTDRFRVENVLTSRIIDTYVPTMYNPVTRSWRWYDDENSITPTVAYGGENVTPTDMYNHNEVRLRQTIAETGGGSQTGRKKLQYSSDNINFVDVGAIGSGAIWSYCDGGGTDDTLVSDILLSISDTLGPYVENGTAPSSYTHGAYQSAEYDFCLQENMASVNTTYYFRIIDVSSGNIIYPGAGYALPQITIGNHDLNVYIDAGFTLAEINLDDAPGPTVGTFDNLIIRDYRGTLAGWSVTVTGSDFSDGLGNTITIDNLTISPTNISALLAESTGGISINGGNLSNTVPLNLATASVNNGAGNFKINGNLSLYIPIATAPGNYSSTLTLTTS